MTAPTARENNDQLSESNAAQNDQILSTTKRAAITFWPLILSSATWLVIARPVSSLLEDRSEAGTALSGQVSFAGGLARRASASACRHDPVRASAPVLTAMPAAGIPLRDVLADSGYAHCDASDRVIPLRLAGCEPGISRSPGRVVRALATLWPGAWPICQSLRVFARTLARALRGGIA